MFDIDDDDIKHLERVLRIFEKKSIPFATRHALNKVAYHSSIASKKSITENFVNRNRYTKNSVKYEKTTSLKISDQSVSWGSQADYMSKQEHGGVKQADAGKNLSIATLSSTKESDEPRAKLPRGKKALNKIKLERYKYPAKNRWQRNKVLTRMAAKTGNRFVFLHLKNDKKGIFQVLGRYKKKEAKENLTVQMLYSFDYNRVIIKKDPWLEPTIVQAAPMAEMFYHDALLYQIKKQKLEE